MLLPIIQLLPKNYLRRIYSVRAGHLASLALTAQADPLIDRSFAVASKSLRVRPRLLRSRKIGIYPENRAIFHADCASDAMLKIEVHVMNPSHDRAAAYPVAIAMP